jgi:hypothetical protein
MSKGNLEGAEQRFKEALRVNPDDEVSRKNLELVKDARGKPKKL